MDKPQFNNVPNTRHKTVDGQEIWKHRTCAVVTHIVAQKQNSSDPDDVSLHYIVGKRGKGVDHSGLLNIPCGHIDWNENLEEAAKREIFEEAGLFENIGMSFAATAPSFRSGAIQFGVPLVYGTGGEIDKGAKGYKEMWDNSAAYNLKRLYFMNVVL